MGNEPKSLQTFRDPIKKKENMKKEYTKAADTQTASSEYMQKSLRFR